MTVSATWQGIIPVAPLEWDVVKTPFGDDDLSGERSFDSCLDDDSVDGFAYSGAIASARIDSMVSSSSDLRLRGRLSVD